MFLAVDVNRFPSKVFPQSFFPTALPPPSLPLSLADRAFERVEIVEERERERESETRLCRGICAQV